MATKTLKARVEIDGEKEYKQAISELNQGNRVLASEMKLLQEQYKGNEGSMEALRAKSDVLERQLSQQRDKVQTLREALKNAATQSGEASQQTQNWQIQLNNAEREQVKLERAVKENNKAIRLAEDGFESTGKKLTTLGDQVSTIADKFGVHLPESVKSALDHVDGFSKGTVAAMGAVVAGVAAAKLAIDGIKAGIEAVQKLNELTLEQAHWADDLLTQSAQTGLSTDLLQQLDYASKFLDFEGLDKSLIKLTQSMDKARDGAKDQAAAFRDLGISVTDSDGQLRDNWETFKDVIDALGEVENATERDALSNDIFGKSYAELKPLIDAGTDSLQDLMDAAVENGHVLDESQIQKLGEVDDAYQEYQTKLDDVKKKLAVEFAPVSTKVMETFGDLAVKAADKLAESGMLENIGAFIEPLGKIGESLLNLADAVLPVVTGALNVAADAFAWAAEKAAAFFDWVSRLDEATIQQTMVDSGDMGYWGDYNPAFAGYNAAGDRNWRGGLTWLGEGGPELVRLPQGSQIYSNQESRQIAAAAPTDTRHMEQLQSEGNQLMRALLNEFSGMHMRGRMLYG